MPDEFEIDPQLMKEFLAESLESLEGLDRLFIMLEEKPDNHSVIDQIFRPIHSIKGNSSFFGLMNVKNFSHAMENILQEVRSQKRSAGKAIIDVLLRGTDLLRAMIERFAEGIMSTDFLPEETACMEEFTAILDTEEDDLASRITAARDAIRALEALTLSPEAEAAVEKVRELAGNVFAQILPPETHVSNGDENRIEYFLKDTNLTEDVRAMASFIRHVGVACQDQERTAVFLNALTRMQDAVREGGADHLLEPLGQLGNDFRTIHESGIGFDDLLGSLLEERFETFMRGITAKERPVEKVKPPAPAAASEPAPSPTQDAPPPKKEEAKADAAGSGKTLRIDEEKVDHFMSFVGELIIASEVFAYLQKKLEPFPDVREIAQEFKNANLSFNELSYNLQRSLMAVRRIPLRQVLQKMPRIIRDVTSTNGKDVQLLIEGEDTQIDKSLLEGLENPLVHMIRNSVDHGIELPEEREAAGKPPRGTVWLTATADEETFRLVIRDDGKGIDLDAVREKAVAKGTITEERARAMSDREAARLIFGAGVSTAKKVTDVSGRGVGMDVVLSNIEKLNGNVDVDTVLGEGTTITITLPMTVTLMVVDGLVARIGAVCYIVPLMDVRESVRPTAEQVFTVTGRGEVVNVRGELCALMRLGEALGQKATISNAAEATVILVEHRGQTCGLMVDEVVGQQSVVLKELGKEFAGLDSIQGGAILGDGRVGLVLNTEGLLARMHG